MLVPLRSGVCETLKKMGVMAVLYDSGFDMYLVYTAIDVVQSSIGRRIRPNGFVTILLW